MFANLKGKVAIVTGAASGLGKGIAEKFAYYGAKVVIADLNLEAAQAVADEIKHAYKVESLAVAMDVTNEEQVNSGVNLAVSTFGQVDVLVSNAGIQIIAPIIDFELAKWNRLMDIHVTGAFLTSKACMQHMIATKTGGKILIMGSVHSVEASLNKSAYVTAKHALMGLTRAIAKEGAAHGIAANLIGPGFVRTPLVDKQIPEQAKVLGISEDEVVKKIMLGETVDGEFTTVDDIANIALFFASFETTALTGQSLLATHGWHME